jgi:hypothetical protein
VIDVIGREIIVRRVAKTRKGFALDREIARFEATKLRPHEGF